jgi:hypothetical protein
LYACILLAFEIRGTFRHVGLDLGNLVFRQKTSQPLVRARHAQEGKQDLANLLQLVLDQARFQGLIFSGQGQDLVRNLLQLEKTLGVAGIELLQDRFGLVLDALLVFLRLLHPDPASEESAVGHEGHPQSLDPGTDGERKPGKRHQREQPGGAQQDAVVLVEEGSPIRAVLVFAWIRHDLVIAAARPTRC